MNCDSLATDFFLIAYDEIRDCPALDPYRLTCGLVGAQLADLVIAGLLTVREDRCVLDTGKRPGNLSRGATLTLDNITREPRRHPVRAWVDTLGPSVTELVCEELVCCNVLTVIHRRSLLGRRQACLAVADPSAVRKPGIILRTMLRQPATFTLEGAILLLLLTTLGAEQLLEPEVDRDAVRSISAQAGEHLAGPLVQLRAGLSEASAAISLAVRR